MRREAIVKDWKIENCIKYMNKQKIKWNITV